MKNEEIIAAIKGHQECPYVHPLTCGNNSGHQNLVGVEQDGKVVLKCPDCDYVQAWIPDVVTSRLWEGMEGFFPPWKNGPKFGPPYSGDEHV